MKQDPITTRFIEVFELLKKEGRVRSARQFALSINTYAQSFNEILKGRREATLQMIQRVTEEYNLDSNYLLTGIGNVNRTDVNGVSTSPQLGITFLQAHQFKAYASSLVFDNTDEYQWPLWNLPVELLGNNIDIAIQCNTDRLSKCLCIGDVLFSRSVPRDAWKSSLSSKRIYALALNDTIHLVRIENNDSQGILLRRDDRDLPVFISFADINEIWCPISKWSHNVLNEDVSEIEDSNFMMINTVLKEQSESIKLLRRSIQNLSGKEALTKY